MVSRKTRRKTSKAKTPFNRVTNAAQRVGKKIRNSVSRVGKKIGNSVRKVFSMKKRKVRRRARKTSPVTPIAQPPSSPPMLEKGGATISFPTVSAPSVSVPSVSAPSVSAPNVSAPVLPAFAAAPPMLSQSP